MIFEVDIWPYSYSWMPTKKGFTRLLFELALHVEYQQRIILAITVYKYACISELYSYVCI